MEVLRSFVPLHVEQGLVRSALTSWLRVTTGFALAAIVAVPLGVYMATFPSVAAFFRPLALTGAYVPIVVFIPLSLTWFGTGETQKIGFLFIGCFVALLPLVIKDIADVPSAFLDVAVTKGASQWQLVRHVLFPVAQANIWDHLRGVYGVGWGWIIMAEVYVRPQYGLGALIGVSERRSQTGLDLCHHYRHRAHCRGLRPVVAPGGRIALSLPQDRRVTYAGTHPSPRRRRSPSREARPGRGLARGSAAAAPPRRPRTW